MNKLINSVLLITYLFIVACSDDNIENTPTPFILEKDYYEIRLERSSTSISITNGSGDISLDIENEDVLQAIYSKYNDDWEEDNLKGHINLYGMQKGVTTLTIIDNVTKNIVPKINASRHCPVIKFEKVSLLNFATYVILFTIFSGKAACINILTCL